MTLKTDPFTVKQLAKARNEYFTILEEQIQFAVRPKPRWMPQRVWLWLLSKLLRMEVWKQR